MNMKTILIRVENDCQFAPMLVRVPARARRLLDRVGARTTAGGATSDL
jgi:hypothetical protein